MDLTEDDVLEILNLIDKSSFDFLKLEVGDLKLTVSKGEYVPDASDNKPAPMKQAEVSAPENPAPSPEKTAEQPEQKQRVPHQQKTSDSKGLLPITAPIVGVFYASPEPGAPPFVEKGKQVNKDTTVGLIEVMKVFTGVRSGVRGVISKVLVSNAQFVEYGQSLFLVNPDRPSKSKGNKR